MTPLKKESESKWLELLQRRDESAYQEFFDRYYFSFVSFSIKYLKEKSEAEDIVQDILYELLSHPQKFSSVLSLKSYLYAAIQNRCLDSLRHHKVEQRYFEKIQEEKEDYYIENIIEEEVYQILREAIKTLPEHTRTVYDLVLQGFNNQEICETLNITMDAVKSHRKRGKKILIERLKPLKQYYLLIPILFLLTNK